MAKMTKTQKRQVRSALSCLQAALDYLDDPRIAICSKRRDNRGEFDGSVEVYDTIIGSPLAQLASCKAILERILSDAELVRMTQADLNHLFGKATSA